MTISFPRSIDLDGNPGVAQLVIAVIFGILATVSVVLRFVARHLSRKSLSWNDYMILCALGATLSMALANIISVAAGGAGLSKHQLSSGELRIYWKSMFAIIITWPIAQSCTKISILLFYIHLFPTKPFRVAAYSLIVVVTLWMIQQVLASLLLCQPISYNWDASLNGHCGNVAANCLAGAAVNTFTDILILILPMPTIWHLHVPLRNKIILSLIFGLGSLICIISIIRLRTLFSYTTAPMMSLFDSDGPLNNNLPILYTVLESSLGVMAACVIIMKPIFTHSTFLHSLSHKFSAWSWRSSGGGGSGGGGGDSETKDSNDVVFQKVAHRPNGSEDEKKESKERRGREGSWDFAGGEGRKVQQDLRILKTCVVDVDLEAAVAGSVGRVDGVGVGVGVGVEGVEGKRSGGVV
ncbi:MAG: hypothetical protein Q9186_005476 [Xanthomendoza sp. 1 TL-2023]